MSDAVLVALITLIGVLVTAVLAYMGARSSRSAAKHAEAVNDAVNHRHPAEPRLLDVVKSIRDHQLRQADRLDLFDLKLDMIQAELREADSHFLNETEIRRVVRDEGDQR